jgi:hypothetical protein
VTRIKLALGAKADPSQRVLFVSGVEVELETIAAKAD